MVQSQLAPPPVSNPALIAALLSRQPPSVAPMPDAHARGKATADEVKAATDDCYESNDYLEGIAAFMEKRSPNFDGT